MRERLLAVLQGHPHDRVPFVQYEDLAGPTREIRAMVGREHLGVLRWSAVHRVEHPHCRFGSQQIERDGLRGVRNILHTPAGDISEEKLYQPTLGAEATRKHCVREPDDYSILAAYLRDIVVREDIARFLRDQRELGDDGGIKMFDSAENMRLQMFDGGGWIGMSLHDLGGNQRAGVAMAPDGESDFFVMGGLTEWKASACTQ